MSGTQAGPDPGLEELAKEQERAEERALFTRYKLSPTPANEEALIERFRPLVYRIVHRFRYSPDQFEDLVQVGTFGLLQAVRRFDPEMNFRFSTFAWQTIQGEIQRYFRDRTWAISVPRDLKERSLKVFNAAQELSRSIGHDPTASELAQVTGLSEEAVQEALELGSAYHPQSFTDNVRESDISYAVTEDAHSAEARDMSQVKRGLFWRSLLDSLPQAEAEVITCYFFQDMTQREIADRLATSQMNVSRIMRKALAGLHKMMRPSDIDNIDTL